MNTQSKEYKEIFESTFQEIQQENQQLKTINLLVTGKSGVGKSTLINTVFGEELAETGVGKPVTDKIQLIEQENFPVRIYDTVGFELEKFGFDLGGVIKSLTKNEIQKLIKQLQKTESPDDDIHVIWYLISGTSSRIENAEIDFINWMVSQNLPVIIALTKSYDFDEAELLKEEIIKLAPNVKEVITLLAKDSNNLSSFGVEQLISETFNLLPDGLKASFVHSQEASLLLKRKEASKAVTMGMAATFGTGFSPVPTSDAPLMMASQTAMMAKITSIYGVDVTKQQVETALTGVLGVSGAAIAGKTIAGNLAKLLPGLGTVGGGLITGGVGMIITGALGHAYIELMELVLKGKVNLSAITPKELTDLLIELLPKYLPQQNVETITSK